MTDLDSNDPAPARRPYPPLPTGLKHLEFWLKRLHVNERKFVYVIQAGDLGTPIKVGKACDVRKRMAGLQTGNAQPLVLLYVIPGYELMEKALHHRLRESRITDFLWWMHDYCEAEKDHYWKTGDLPRVPDGFTLDPDPETPTPQPKPRMAPRSFRRNRNARLRAR